MHLLFLLVQAGGYVNDWYEAHQQQKEGEKTPDNLGLDRRLVELEQPIGSTVRVAGSYYNELTALNFAMFWCAMQIIFVCYWFTLGHTMKEAAHRVVQDNEKSTKFTIPKKDPLKKQIFMVSAQEAKKMVGENDEELG